MIVPFICKLKVKKAKNMGEEKEEEKKVDDFWNDNFDIDGLAHIPKSKNVGWKGDPNRKAKNILQEYCQKFYYPRPKYKLIIKEGTPHDSLFTAVVIGEVGINHKTEKLFLTGKGHSIIHAQYKAAEKACDMLGLKYKSDDDNEVKE